MKVSIVTVCLNSEKTIAQTLDSVLMQSHRPLEYIVIDGISTDSTLNILQKYEQKFRELGIDFSYISEKDSGIYDAMNKGIKRVTGEVIGILNSDDWYQSDALLKVHEVFEKDQKIDIAYGFMRLITKEQESKIVRYNYDHLLDRDIVPHGGQHPAVFVRKAIYDNFMFNQLYKIAADYDFLLKAKYRGAIFFAIDDILTNYRTGGISNNNIFLLQKEKISIQLKYGLISLKQARKDLLYLYCSTASLSFVRKIAKYFYFLLPKQLIQGIKNA